MAHAASPDVKKISVPEKHASIMWKFAGLPSEVQSAIYRAVAAIPASTDPWDWVRNELSNHLQAYSIDAKVFLNALRGIYHTRQALPDLSDAEYVEAAISGINSSADSNVTNTAALQGALVNLLSLKNLSISHIAEAIVYEHAYHLHDSDIITDLRPVFDLSGSAIETSVILHTLRLNYASASEEEKTLYLAVDESDLEQLEMAIKRARRKEVALRSATEKTELKPLGDGNGN